MKQNNDIKERTKAVWGTSPAGTAYGKGHEKGSQLFFEAVLEKRFSYEVDWLDGIVDFKRFKDRKVLEIGCGAGYDTYQFCKIGAQYTGIDITPENPLLTKKHLSYYGYDPRVLEMDVEQMSFMHEFDYVYSFGVLHHVPNIEKALSNIYTALKPGGEAQIILYHKNSIFYWVTLFLVDWILRCGWIKHTLKDRLAMIEYSDSDELSLVNVYSKKQACKLLKKAGFSVIQTDVRKLLKEDLPDIPIIRSLYCFIPQSMLNALGKRFGWYVSVRAIKV